ncbi:two component, sigma54 specific, transcriptional regulator, Fis family [Desulfovibrio sp. X2]|uniref:sigma-54-dependent transcriptional regulator n=1 Tax=Desulfovibrio sp. X2 TaxID=941449 RepID=UPI0003588542|nr:sigma-54 dependent transcriptional regulator [Desulfovibrio sp. X2]EPR42097.1 two component, sigma54 specific, transcriptional regulator, Fis family [Desulfovibrio sp. X2]
MSDAAAMHILIVDDEADFARGLKRLVEGEFPDVRVQVATSGEQAAVALRRGRVNLLITDLQMPGMNGMALLDAALRRAPFLSAVVLTAHGSIEIAVEALKAGAYDFLTKPIEPETLFRVVAKGLERSRLLTENRDLRDQLERRKEHLIGESPAMEQLRKTIAAAAQTEYTVLIMGESGTGKELVASMVRDLSRRADKPFVAVNCTAIPENLLESELFGHVKGAFSGADKDRDGLFVRADSGTILLDEIGDIPLETQAKLLRVLQEGEIRPVGSDRARGVDVRVIASTNQDLPARVAQRTFREDLYHRLNVLALNLPPLRERKGDVLLLARYFMHKACAELGLPDKELSPEVLGHLAAGEWPGNVRELQNTIRRLAVFGTSGTVAMDAVRLAGGEPAARDGELPLFKEAKGQVVDGFTRDYIREAMARAGGNVSQAARISGLSRVAVQNMLARFGITTDEFK